MNLRLKLIAIIFYQRINMVFLITYPDHNLFLTVISGFTNKEPGHYMFARYLKY